MTLSVALVFRYTCCCVVRFGCSAHPNSAAAVHPELKCVHVTDGAVECRYIFVQGLPIVRAFRAEGRFFRTCCERIDDMNRFVVPSYTTEQPNGRTLYDC
jgi:hypothetical protein